MTTTLPDWWPRVTVRVAVANNTWHQLMKVSKRTKYIYIPPNTFGPVDEWVLN